MRKTILSGAAACLALVLGGVGACAADDGGAPLDAGPTADVAQDPGGVERDVGADTGALDLGGGDPGPVDSGMLDPGGADLGATETGGFDLGMGADAPADAPADSELGGDDGGAADVSADASADAGADTSEPGDVLAAPCQSDEDCGTLDATGVAGVGAVVALRCDGDSGLCHEPGGLCDPEAAMCALGSSCGYDLLLGLGVCTCSPADVNPPCFAGQSCGLGPLAGVFGVAHCYAP